MSACEELAANASAGVAPALRAVDCLSHEATAAAFGRLFGAGGALVPALTILLTLYIAFFAVSLLTGRSRLGMSALTPKMMTLGLVLTFATSWIAYQSVVWNLATGGPDEIAGVLTGADGSATQIFADRIDMIFAAIAEVSGAGGQQAAGAAGASAGAASAASGSFTPGNLMWLGALLLLIGTVGVLVTARIALAVLLALGPVFVVLALFPGTRGLTAGWLRGVVMTAITPLFVVTGGGIVMELLVPVVAALRSMEGGVDGRAAMALFMIAFVHVSLMAMVLRVSATMVAAWRVFGLAGDSAADAARPSGNARAAALPASGGAGALAGQQSASVRRAPAMASAAHAAADTPSPTSGPGPARSGRTVTAQVASTALPPLPVMASRRARGIGSRYQTPPSKAREMFR